MLTVDIKKKLSDFTLNISFTAPNKTIVLFGPSGCGKTTILRCIAGLLKPDEGSIVSNDTVFYSSTKAIHLPPKKRNVSYMFQDFALFPHMNVKHNIWYGVKTPSQEANELYEKLITLLKIEHLPHRSISQLSGGEKQRVAMARALMAEPQILLLDEPLSALDAQSRYELQDELKRLQEIWNIPFVLVTHSPEEAQAIGSEVLFLHQGQQVSEPPPSWNMNGNGKTTRSSFQYFY
ncbi:MULTISPECIES: ATP-binding cassette domain-containing protein [Pelosinus]|uniref:ABC transporter related protein n=1 Tax=Pelosinus fermentans B4 TaxID=1149862 RepID=I8RJ79_9FIRM|nr:MULTISPECIES: ATP-binding cassette domain-containing protein [Pelosinus]EIW20033.1 ABC transporter related protein [Pelosinus fermentans B4]EIW26112.1 ABC transporter related protein [Pelosinus fermentans A11]OAM93161.1 Molybdate-transporting ATPase [Pelosinus fermentans DSM 17108]SDQ68918.1 molybdate transport system ATP-binding protein [Pelosinus fermentans]